MALCVDPTSGDSLSPPVVGVALTGEVLAFLNQTPLSGAGPSAWRTPPAQPGWRAQQRCGLDTWNWLWSH